MKYAIPWMDFGVTLLGMKMVKEFGYFQNFNKGHRCLTTLRVGWIKCIDLQRDVFLQGVCRRQGQITLVWHTLLEYRTSKLTS